MPERNEGPAEWEPDSHAARPMRWERDDAGDAVPEAAREQGHAVAEPVSGERPATQRVAPSEPRPGRAEDGGDIGERARRGAEECDALLLDVEEIRAAIRDLRAAGADRAAEADGREAEESLAHDADVTPQRRFGEPGDLIARRRERDAAREREREHPAPSADLAEDILDRVWDDVPADRSGDVLDRIWSDPWVERDHEERELGL